MQRFFLISLIFMMGVFFTQAQTATEQTELHLVKRGETLYHLSQIYNTTVSHLLDLNPTIVNNKLEAGVNVKVPHVVQPKTVKIGPPQYLTPITYMVGKGETLYSISKKTNNDIQTIRLWNDLKNDDIKAGQKIIVGYGTATNSKNSKTIPASTTSATTPASPKALTSAPATTTASTQPAAKTPATTTAPVKTNATKTVATTSSKTATTTKLETKTPAETAIAMATVPNNTKPVLAPTKPAGKLTYMSEKGVATWSKGNNDDGQFYALHPTAPVGTVITVKNMMNNSSVQVKVIGKLPNTAENQNVMIKLSGSAAKQLNVLDDKFLATINYMGVKGE